MSIPTGHTHIHVAILSSSIHLPSTNHKSHQQGHVILYAALRAPARRRHEYESCPWEHDSPQQISHKNFKRDWKSENGPSRKLLKLWLLLMMALRSVFGVEGNDLVHVNVMVKVHGVLWCKWLVQRFWSKRLQSQSLTISNVSPRRPMLRGNPCLCGHRQSGLEKSGRIVAFCDWNLVLRPENLVQSQLCA